MYSEHEKQFLLLEAGDIILEVNDKDVVSLTTKEVLKCLRLSKDVVTLKVKKDATVKERVHNHMAASSELEALRRSYAKENSSSNGHIDTQHKSEKFESNGDVRENGENIPPSPTQHIKPHTRQSAQPKFETFMMTGELIIKTKSSNTGFISPKNNFKQHDEIKPASATTVSSNFCKVENDVKSRGRTTKRESPDSHSPVAEKKGSFSYGGNFVRTSRSEDYLQKNSVSTVNIEVDEEIATSLNNLLDTNKDNLSSDQENWSSNSPVSAPETITQTSPTELNDESFFVNTVNDIRTGQFIHIPNSNDREQNEKLVSETSNMITTHNRQRYTPRTIQPKQDGVTNIMIDENKIYVKVLPDQTLSDENTISSLNNKLQCNANNESPRNLKNAEDCRNEEISYQDTITLYTPEDESDIESLSSFHYSPKAIDMPSASRLAKRLYYLEGFKKSDVSRHLCKNRVVAEEYLKFFDFHGETLDVALRKFLKQFCLIGETQERERVLVHFSKRFLDCNEGAFKSQDAVHTLTCALMLLNTDLHGENVGRRMTCAEFIENLSELNEGENFSKEVLKALYHSIKTTPLEWAVDDEEEPATEEHPPNHPEQRQSFIGHNPFLEVPNPNCQTEYKKGYVMRKCCIDPNGKKTPIGKRGWKMFYADLRDLVLYLHKDENGCSKRQMMYDSLHNAIRIHHALATRATDYTKKQHVFRLQTADQAVYLFQTRYLKDAKQDDSKELQSWIDTINYVAACFSAPSLAPAVGAQKKFQRPLLPVAPTKLNFREQLLELESRVMKLEKEIEEHLSQPPDRSAKSRVVNEFVEKENFLQYELKRYRTYTYLLRSKAAQFPELEPPLVETSIGEVDEQLEKNDQTHAPASSTENSNSVKRSLSDRFSYRAAIYKTGPTDDGA
ncbi:PH and SEC7 domain-containing protein 3 [Trichonephila clavata]|uniref:PH and SEC7 domain-containing protein 4 n=1 Tax=Trichonephila clavata TaxID=2740835 RepID=A0A8X6FA97_TRICU|nr:PH and SEC7 domain-containing protein 3 [Trichonephila clavata]